MGRCRETMGGEDTRKYVFRKTRNPLKQGGAFNIFPAKDPETNSCGAGTPRYIYIV